MSSVYKFKTRPPSQASAKARLFWLICYLSFPHVLSDLESSEPGSVENYDISMDSMEGEIGGWVKVWTSWDIRPDAGIFWSHPLPYCLNNYISNVTVPWALSTCPKILQCVFMNLITYGAEHPWSSASLSAIVMMQIQGHRSSEMQSGFPLKQIRSHSFTSFTFTFNCPPKTFSLLFAIVPLTPVSPFNYHNSLFGISFVNWIALKQ